MSKDKKPLHKLVRYPMPPPTKADVDLTTYDRNRIDDSDDDDIMDEVREILERKKRSQARLNLIKKIC